MHQQNPLKPHFGNIPVPCAGIGHAPHGCFCRRAHHRHLRRNLTWSVDTETGTLTISGTGKMDDYDVGYYENAAPWSESGVQITKLVVEEGVTSIGVNAFAFCGALLEASLPSTLERIGDSAFAYCVNMTSINVPADTQLSNSAFNTCTALQDENGFVIINGILYDYFYDSENPIEILTIPNGVTTITAGFVYGNPETVTRVDIPSSVTYIGYGAFSGCHNLSNIIFDGDAPVIEHNAFESVTALVEIPEGNRTWNVNTALNYGGDLTWPEVLTIQNDNNPPRATNVAVKEVGTDEIGNKILYLSFNVTDTAEDVLWADECHIGISVNGFHNPDGGEGLWFESLQKQDDDSYLAVIRLDNNWYGDFTVRHIYLADQFGNGDEVILDDAGVTGTIPRVYTENFTVGDFTLNGGTSNLAIELTADNLSQDLTFKAPFTLAEGANFPGGELFFWLRNTGTGELIEHTGWAGEEDGTYYVALENISVGFGVPAGTYELARMSYAGMDVHFGSCPTFTVTKVQDDFDAPVLEELWFTVNDGDKVTNSFTVKESDVLKAYAKITDESRLVSHHISLVSFDYSGDPSILLEYDEASGLYVGTLDAEALTTYMSNTVWFVDRVWAEDIFCNNLQDYSLSSTHFFTKTDSEGNFTATPIQTCSEFMDPFFHNSVGFEFYDEDGIATLGEIMAAGGTTITPPEMEGLTFQGWYLEYLGRIVTEDEALLLNPYEPLVFRPVYDKLCVTLDIEYVNQNDGASHDELVVLLPHGATYADLLAEMENFTCTHTGAANFVEWTINETLTDEIPADTSAVWVCAKYDKHFFHLNYNYMDANGNSRWDEMLVTMDAAPTVGEVYEYFLSEAAPSLTHYAGLGEVTWLISDGREEDEIVNSMDYCGFSAEYENSFVRVGYNYYGEDGWTQHEDMILMIEPGSTYADVFETFKTTVAPNIKHYEGIGEVEWTLEEGLPSTDPVSSGDYIWINSQYDKILVETSFEYYNTDNESGWANTFLVLPLDATYADAIDAAMEYAAEFEHAAILGEMTGWDKGFEYENPTDPVEGMWLHFNAQYEKLPVFSYLYYIDADGELAEDVVMHAMEEGDTYQDVYDLVDLNVTHASNRTFVKWDTYCWSDSKLTDEVTHGTYLDIYAVYASYPITVTYSYLGNDGKVVTGTTTINAQYGDNILDLINEIDIPAHSLSDQALGWALDPLSMNWFNSNDPYMVDLYMDELHIAVIYEDKMPCYSEILYLDADTKPAQRAEVEYVPYAGHDEDSLMQATDPWIDSLYEVIEELSDPDLLFDKDNCQDFGSMLGGYEITTLDEATETDVPTGVYTMTVIRLCVEYDKDLLILTYPDGTEEEKLVDHNSDFTLLETADGKELIWVYEYPHSYEEYKGGETIESRGPYVYLTAFYADGSEYEPEPEPTPEPTPAPTPDNTPDEPQDDTSKDFPMWIIWVVAAVAVVVVAVVVIVKRKDS